jgi:hypothetical protein
MERHMGPPKRRGSRRQPRSRHTRAATRPRPELAIVVRGGVVQGVYANRCGPLTVYLLDYDDLRTDDDLAEAVGRTAELPQVAVETALARAVAEYRAAAAGQARLRRAAEFRGPGLNR